MSTIGQIDLAAEDTYLKGCSRLFLATRIEATRLSLKEKNIPWQCPLSGQFIKGTLRNSVSKPCQLAHFFLLVQMIDGFHVGRIC